MKRIRKANQENKEGVCFGKAMVNNSTCCRQVNKVTTSSHLLSVYYMSGIVLGRHGDE